MNEELKIKLGKLGIVARGNFQLKNGASSDVYLDVRRVYNDPDLLRLIGLNLSEKIRSMRIGPDFIACSGYGGIPLGVLVSQNLNLPLTLVRERIKEHGMQSRLEGHIPDSNENFCVVDDVFSSGTSIQKTIEGLAYTNARCAAAIVVVERESRNNPFTLYSLLKAEDLLNYGH